MRVWGHYTGPLSLSEQIKQKDETIKELLQQNQRLEVALEEADAAVSRLGAFCQVLLGKIGTHTRIDRSIPQIMLSRKRVTDRINGRYQGV